MSGKRLRSVLWLACALFSLLLVGSISAGGSSRALASAPLDAASDAAADPAPIYMVPPIDDGFDGLPNYLKARSYSGLVKAGLVHPAGALIANAPTGKDTKPLAPQAPLSTISWGSAINMSNDNGANEPAAAMHPSNALLALSGGNGNSVGTHINNTSDGGATWSTRGSVTCNSGGDGVQTWLGALFNNGSNALNATLCVPCNTCDWDLPLSRSTDNGATWTSTGTTAGVTNIIDDREYLWTDHNPNSPFYNRTYVTVAYFNTGAGANYNTVGMRFTTDQGNNWSPAVSLVTPTEFQSGTNHNEYPSLAIEPDGSIVEAWHRGACSCGISTSNKVMWSRSTDGGVTFPVSGTIVTVPQNQSVFFNSTSPGGFRWSDTPNIAADPVDGTLYAVWVQFRTASVSASAAVYISRGTPDGFTWTTPVIVYNNPNANLFQYMPWVQVSEDHVVHVTFSGGVGNNSTLAHFYAQSTDRGQTFTSPPIQLSNGTFSPFGFMGDYQAASVGGYNAQRNTSGTGSILAAWTDTTGSQENQWARVGTFTQAVPPSSDIYDYTNFTSATIISGTTDIGNHCDDCATRIGIPFTFHLYDATFNNVYVSSNGILGFQSSDSSVTNQCLPSGLFPFEIYPHWDDMRTDAGWFGCNGYVTGCGIFTSVSGFAPNRILNIEWRGVYFSNTAQAANFEARLYEGAPSRFDFIYGFMAQGGSSATIGVQENPGGQYTEYSCNVPAILHFGDRIFFTDQSHQDYSYTVGSSTIVPGTTDIGNHCDDCTTNIELPFTFRLYEQNFDHANISSNGVLEFNSNATAFSNSCLPNAGFSYSIFAHWDDLTTSPAYTGCNSYASGCGIFTSVTGIAPSRVFNIEWRAALLSGAGPVNVEVRLYEASQSRFDLLFGTVTGGGATGTVGVQQGPNDHFTLYECNTNIISTNLLLQFFDQSAGNYNLTFSNGNTGQGVTDIGNHCDDCTTNIVLPFPYKLYESTFYTLNASANGNLQFLSNSGNFANTCMPYAPFNYAIMPYFDDLRTDGASGAAGIFTSISGDAPNRIFTIEWRACIRVSAAACTAVDTNFEVRLYENMEKFDFIYGNVTQAGLGATVGVERAGGGTAFTQQGCNVSDLSSGLRITFTLPPSVTVLDSLTTADPSATARLFRDGSATECGVTEACPGTVAGTFHYTTYTYQNTSAEDICVTVNLDTGQCANGLFSTAYLGSFNPSNLCLNYLGDAGSSTLPGDPSRGYSFTVPAGAVFIVVVNEVSTNLGCSNYTLTVSGFDAPVKVPFTPTATPTRTFTPTPTDTPTFTNTPTFTPTFTPTPTATPTCGGPALWQTASPVPTSVVRYGFARNGDDLYVMSGVSGGASTTDARRYNAASDTWTSLAPIPVGREAPASALLSNRIYIAGGLSGSATSSLHIYDIASNTWLTGATMLTATWGSAAGAFNGRVFVVGGNIGPTGPTTISQVYTVATNSWAAGPALPSGYWLGGYTQVGQFLYLVGSYGSTATLDGDLGLGSLLDIGKRSAAAPDANGTSTLRLDMSTGLWTIGPTWTQARADMAVASDGTKLFAIGGDTTGGSFFNPSAQVDELLLSSWPGGTWVSSIPPLPSPHQANQAGFFSTGRAGGEIWSTGGLTTGQVFTNDHLYRPMGINACPPTPTFTFSPTPTFTATPTFTTTRTNSPTNTPTNTPTITPSNTPTNTPANTFTSTPTNTPTNTPTITLTITPTNTPTNTPTFTATPAILVGHVTWQGPPAQPNVRQQLPITLTLRLGANPDINFTGLTTDSSGFFTVTVTGLPAGSYSWRAKGPKYLANCGTVALGALSTTQQEMGTERAGDCDAAHNNIVNITDFNILKGVFGTASTVADFNNDGVVNITDFNLLKGNFGQAGCNPILATKLSPQGK